MGRKFGEDTSVPRGEFSELALVLYCMGLYQVGTRRLSRWRTI